MLTAKGSVVTATKEQEQTTESERVENWRVILLTEEGMTYDDAWQLAKRPTWRDALRAMELGCDPDLAFKIAR